MIQVRNNSVLSSPVAIASTGSVVPFDSVSINTNGNTSLNNNAVLVSSVGIYNTQCEVVLQNTSTSAPVTVTLTQMNEGSAVTGATVTQTIPESSTGVLFLDWTTNVVGAINETANISWFVSGGAVNLVNAIGKVSRYV